MPGSKKRITPGRCPNKEIVRRGPPLRRGCSARRTDFPAPARPFTIACMNMIQIILLIALIALIAFWFFMRKKGA
jgi:hypothetical protein